MTADGPRLPEDERLRCACQTAGPGEVPAGRCGWRATGEDMLCTGCRAWCARGTPMRFEPNAQAAARLRAGLPHQIPAVHLDLNG